MFGDLPEAVERALEEPKSQIVVRTGLQPSATTIPCHREQR